MAISEGTLAIGSRVMLPNGSTNNSLSELNDVNISSPSNNQILKYDSTSSKWVNANESGSGTASDTSYDNTSSGLTATNVQGAIDEVTNRFVYSTDEKVIGKWIDGKPLYQKTVDCGALPNNTTKNVAHNISNISKIVNIFGIGIGDNCLPLPYNITVVGGLQLYANNTNIVLATNIDLSTTNGYVTLQYTKSTD